MSNTANERKRFFVYQDESGEPGKARYFLIGVLVVDDKTRKDILDAVARIRQKYSFYEELHFKKVSSRRFPIYKDIMTEVGSFPLRFCAMVIDNTRLDLRYFSNKRYLAYNKFCCLAIFHNIKSLNGDVYVFTDAKSRIKEDNFLDYLEFQLQFEAFCHDLNYNVRTVEPKDSKQEDLIQVTDLFLGAINSMYTHPKSPRKRELADMMREMVNAERYKFNVWCWRPKTQDDRP